MSVPHPKVAVDRRAHAQAHGTNQHKVIVLHSTEGHDRPGISDVDGVLRFLEKKGYGVHAVVDGEGNVGRGAYDSQLVYHCAGANSIALGIEMVGFAKWKTDDWLHTYLPTRRGRKVRVARRQLLTVAQLVAHWSEKHGIPLRLSTTNGIATHAMFPEGGHWDPGPGFPIGYVLKHARRLRRTYRSH